MGREACIVFQEPVDKTRSPQERLNGHAISLRVWWGKQLRSALNLLLWNTFYVMHASLLFAQIDIDISHTAAQRIAVNERSALSVDRQSIRTCEQHRKHLICLNFEDEKSMTSRDRSSQNKNDLVRDGMMNEHIQLLWGSIGGHPPPRPNFIFRPGPTVFDYR